MLRDNVRKTLQNTVNQLVDKLQQGAPKDSGNLARSISGKVDGDSIEITAADYAIMIDKGVNGTKRNRGSIFGYTNKKPPISSIKGFAKAKGINEYALQRSIFENGTRKQPFIDRPFNAGVNELNNELPQAIWEDFIGEVANGNSIFKKQ